MDTLFNMITQDESTLAANMVLHAHKSIETWAARHGINVKMSDEDFHSDMEIMEKALKGISKLKAVMYINN